MAVKAFFLLSIVSHIIHAQTDVWYEQMNTDPAASTWTGTAPLQVTGDATNCPSPNDYCWSVSTAASYSRVDATSAFTSVEFTYSINVVGSLTGPDACVIEYSVDDSVYNPIETIDKDTLYSTRTATWNTWTGVAGIPALYIRIRLAGGGFTCYLNEFRLHGTPATSSPTNPSSTPTKTPTAAPSGSPSQPPTTAPSGTPSDAPSGSPSQPPSTAPSGIPSDAPSGSPSQPPSTAPSDAPTDTPSGSPSQPPSKAPSGIPSDAPSGSPSQPPSKAPSNAPIPIPTTAPTSTTNPPSEQPTPAPTDNPTKTPTYAPVTIVSCGTLRYCYYVDIAPVPGVVQSRMITIQDIDRTDVTGYYTYYDIYLTPTGNHCVDPSITLFYEPIDYDSGGTIEGLWVYSATGSTIATCSSTLICTSPTTFVSCLNSYNLAIHKLPADQQSLLVSIAPAYQVDDFCTTYHNYVINAQLTITCSYATADPTSQPSKEPTKTPTAVSVDPTPAPTSAPTSPPTTAPTSITSSPTDAPSGSPTAPPTNTPSQPPTDAPSFSPSAQTITPTTIPTTGPTAITLNPTPNPTAKTSCGTNKYCYSVDVVPFYRKLMSTPITIQDVYISSDTYYDVSFNIIGYLCNRPSLSFKFERIDNNSGGECLWLTYLGSQIAAACGIANSCGSYYEWLSGYSLNSALPVNAGETILLSIQRDSSVQAFCNKSPTYHSWAINAVLTLTCDDTTLSPTSDPTPAPTEIPTSPTSNPSRSPTPAPTDSPTDAPTHATVTPTAAPTDVPTFTPTGAPTQPPTKAPTGSPSAPPTSAPTSPTITPTTDPTLEPTLPTSMPTDAPTYYVSCGTDRYCHYRSIEPITGNLTSEDILIQDIDHNAYTYYDIVIDITGSTDCKRPTLDMTYERIDNQYTGDTIQVSYENSLITTCPYVSNFCGEFWTCLSSYNLPSTIAVGDTVTITLTKASAVHAQCTSYHLWAINVVLSVTCNDLPTTAAPTQSPTEETVSPTLDPTDPPTSQYCSRDNTDGNVHCYSSSVYSIYTYTTSSYYVYIQRYDGDSTDIYDVYFTAWSGVCYAPHINVRYRSMQTYNGLSILDDNDGVIGSCSAERDCNSYIDCLIDYDLGLDRLEYRKTYRLTLFGRNLVNYCSSYSYYTIDAYIEFICNAIPTTTLPPTGVPTTPTTDPTTALPTQPTLDPTPNPTLDVADGSDVFTYYIISCIWKDNTYSLILMTVSGDGVYLGFDLFLESPIPRSAITSSLELKDDSYCIDSDCTQFWDIKYSLQCDIALNGIWKAQFSTNCNGDDYIERKECLDYLSSVGITANKAALNSYNEFALNDELCIKSLYSKVFTPIITYYKDNGFTGQRTDGNSKYKVGDTVYVDIAFIDEEYDVNDVSIGLIFGCELGNSSRNITESQALDGITPCLLNTPYIIQSDSQGGHVWFTLPFTKSEQFAAQIQAIINVNSKSKQIRHLMLNIVLNGKANAASRAGAIGRGAIAAIVIAVILILCIVIVAYYKCCRPHNNNNNKAKMDDAVQLEAVKSISQNETSPTTEVQAAAVVTKGEGKAPKKTVSKSKAPKKAELAAAAKKAGSGGGKKANANRKEPKKKLPSAPVASKDKKAHKNKNKKQQNTGKKKKSGNKNKGKKVND